GLSNVAEEVGVTVGLKHKKINVSNSRGRGRLDRKGAAASREGVEVGWFGAGEEKGGKGRGGRQGQVGRGRGPGEGAVRD
nr:nicalin-1 [Tanacetum cinerariifolium]